MKVNANSRTAVAPEHKNDIYLRSIYIHIIDLRYGTTKRRLI